MLELSALSCLTSSFLYNSGCNGATVRVITSTATAQHANEMQARRPQIAPYLDKTETGIAAVLQAADAELNVRQIESVRQLALEALVSHRYDG